MKFLVTGGYFGDSTECFVDCVDVNARTRRRVVSFFPPPKHAIAAKGFTGGAWFGEDLLVCSFDSVWRFSRDGQLVGQLHQPNFNDLHGVAVLKSGLIAICNTGLDSIETFDSSGRFAGRFGLTPAWFEAARQGGQAVDRASFDTVLGGGWTDSETAATLAAEGDYYDSSRDEPFHRRRVRDYFHPNNIVEFGDTLAVTMLATEEIRCLKSMSRFAKLPGNPHDGVVYRDALYCTLIDGRVLQISASGEPTVLFNVTQSEHAGWCRGLSVGENGITVGITRLVGRSRFHWRSDFDATLTETALLHFDHHGRLEAHVPLDAAGRHTKIFSILPLHGSWT